MAEEKELPNILWRDKKTGKIIKTEKKGRLVECWVCPCCKPKVKAHIQLCLAIAAKAFNAKCASTKAQRPYNAESARYDLRVFLLRLGMIGTEFKNTRMHLMKRMPGSAAWKNGRPAGR